jgi:adenine-specific DNA-methyltransferase
MADPGSLDLFGPITTGAPRARTRSRQSQLGQYLTPGSISAFMAGLFPALPPSITLLDAGAGAGALMAAFVTRWQAQRHGTGRITAHAYELDTAMLEILRKTADELRREKGIDAEVIEGDFIERAATMLRLERGPRYTHAVLNPPYKKINSGSRHSGVARIALGRCGAFGRAKRDQPPT